MRVVKGQRQSGRCLEQPQGILRNRNERTDVGLDREGDARGMSLLAAPGEFFAAPAKRSRAGLLREEDAGQRGDMFSAAFAGVFQGLLKELPGLGASAGIRVVWRQRDEFRGRLQENVGQLEAAIRELEPQGASVLAEIPELGQRLKMRTALKESNVHTLKAQHRNEVQSPIVGQ